MAYDISGNYTRVHNWTLDRDNGIKIQATRMDEECNDYSSSFNLLVLRDGRAPMSGNLKMGTNKITGLGAPTLAGDALSYGSALGTPITGNLTNCTALPLATGVTGILPVANGGTGNGTGAIPVGQITGVLPVANGGTGNGTGSVPVGQITGVLPVANGGTGNGTGAIPVGQITGVLPVANGGTGNGTNTSAACSGNAASASTAVRLDLAVGVVVDWDGTNIRFIIGGVVKAYVSPTTGLTNNV